MFVRGWALEVRGWAFTGSGGTSYPPSLGAKARRAASPPLRAQMCISPGGPQPKRRSNARTSGRRSPAAGGTKAPARRFETVEARPASARSWTAAVLRRFQVDQYRCAHRRDFELGQERRRAGGRRSDGVANVRWNVRRAGGRRSDRASSPLSVVRAFGAGCAFRVGCDRGTGSRLASRIELVPIFACIRICNILRVRAGLSSAGTRARTGRHWSAGLPHGVISELAPETIGAPASGTASFLNAFAPSSKPSSQPSSQPLSNSRLNLERCHEAPR
jgi:hypothetical protein